MSRSITIGYRHDPPAGRDWTRVEVQAPYDLLGTQRLSKEFWALPRLREIGITRLTELGSTDPVYFVDWDGMAELGRELAQLQQHLRSINYHPELTARWVAHLVYCHGLLVLSTPTGCIPELTIG